MATAEPPDRGMPPLEVDGDQIAQFVASIFKYADADTFVSLRAHSMKRMQRRFSSEP
jgi:hypothetical protein